MLCVLAVLALVPGLGATEQHQDHRLSVVTEVAASPVRKVITLLQNMQAKVSEEGEKQEALYSKFVCYCKKNSGELSESIQVAQAKIESTTAALTVAAEKKTQTEADLKEHSASQDEAKDTIRKSTALRKKEAAAYAKVKADSDANVAALAKAIAAVTKGATGTFLQTPAATEVRKVVMESAKLRDTTREELLSYLQGTQRTGYVPQSGEITGILKELLDEMSSNLAEATADEQSAIQNFAALMSAKKKEVASLQMQIEEEMKRVGNLAVSIAGMSNDIEDTKVALSADEKFKLELASGCDSKAQEMEDIKKTRAEELLALAETIKVLSDDDALELFKKTIPSASMSLVQLEAGHAATRGKAQALLKKAASHGELLGGQPGLDLIALALHGKKVGFDKVISLIDKMVANLKQEQNEDDNKKEYCDDQLDKTEDKRKALAHSLSDSDADIAETQGTLAELAEEIAVLVSGIKALDASVAEATELRKKDAAEHQELVASDTTAKKVLLWAKNRLNKFYMPSLYKPPPEREMTEDERIAVNMGGTLAPVTPGGIAGTGIGVAALVQIFAHAQQQQQQNEQQRGALPPPPEVGSFAKKTAEGKGVIAMIDLLIKDLDKELAEAGVNEKEAQAEYEKMMADSAGKRAADSKLITQKTAEKASSEEALQMEQDARAGAARDLLGTQRYMANLHAECDWLIRYHDMRKEARAGEIESLNNAKAVLKGADYSLLQPAKKAFMAKVK